MKSKILLFALMSVVVGGSFYLGQEREIVANYQSRESLETANSADGMHEIYAKLRGNVETGIIDPKDYAMMRKAVEQHNATHGNNRSTDLSWIEMGPDNVGGRTRAILAVDSQTLYAGSVSGGLWKTTNGANTWSKVSSLPACIIGSIAQDGNGTIYVGTGNDFEGFPLGEGQSQFTGNGLWKSDDDGATWSVIDGTVPTFLAGNANWNAINSLETDPLHSSRVWIGADAGFGYYDNSNGDLVMNTISGIANGGVMDIDVSEDGQTILVALGAARIFRSTNGGDSFEEISGSGTDLPSSNGRARVALSKTEPNHMFVLYALGNGNMGGVYYSGDTGNSWTNLWPEDVPELDPTGSNNQGNYDLALIVAPFDPTLAFVGAVTHWKVGPTNQSEPAAFNFGFGEEQLYVHSDIHEYIFAPNGDFYIGTDGGIFKSTNNGFNYYSANRGYNVTQFYGIAHGSRPIGATSLGNEASSIPSVAGGSQDNGTQVIFGDGAWNSPQQAIEAMGGDGFDCDMAQVTEGQSTVLFATSQYGMLQRMDQNGSGGMFFDDTLLTIYEDNDFEPGGFYSCIRLFEDTEDEDSEQYITYVNPFDEDIYDEDPDDGIPATITLLTNNLNIPYEVELEPNDTIHFWPEIIRPAFVSEDSLTADPNYWWLEPQQLLSKNVECMTDSMILDTVQVIDDIIEETLTVYWTDTLIVEGEEIIVNDSTVVVIGADTIWVDQINYSYSELCDTTWSYAGDTLINVAEQRQYLDTYTSLFALGLKGANGLWVTRQALNLNTTPQWFEVVTSVPSGGIKAIEFSPDGNTMYYSGWNNSLYRITGLDHLWTQSDVANLEHTVVIANAGGVVTGIAFDPNWSDDNQHMVITVGGYGTVNDGHVRETFNALADAVAWNNIWFDNGGELARMPCYDAIIDVNDPSGQTIVLGTEFGVYVTDNAGGTNGEDWVQANNPTDPNQSTGIDACPVMSIKQQQVGDPGGSVRWRAPQNYGIIYAGSHGRGIFRSEEGWTVNVEEYEPSAKDELNLITVYPNPTAQTLYLDVTLNSAELISAQVYSITGDLVKTINQKQLAPGKHTLQLDVSDLTTGNYIINFEAGNQRGVAKFVVMD
ncbi:MAG: T9SS type A sorting domain-containing protein [Flavobacteriales bacterium]|nr:T9SS type A sorting domain-containing protein [Flavobacteriales bacterium]